MRICKS